MEKGDTYDTKPRRDGVAWKGLQVVDGSDKFIERPVPGIRLHSNKSEVAAAEESSSF